MIADYGFITNLLTMVFVLQRTFFKVVFLGIILFLFAFLECRMLKSVSKAVYHSEVDQCVVSMMRQLDVRGCEKIEMEEAAGWRH